MNYMPSDNPKDFDANPFVSGALTGRRAFRIVRENGEIHLWGPVYSHDWVVDDVNHAACLSWGTKKGVTPAHKVASQGCKCGWWAYFGETPETRTYRNSFHGEGFGVEGIIFGFGKCGAGQSGFRAAKARVKALIVPDECTDLELLDEAMSLFADNSEFRWYGTFAAAEADWPLSQARKYGFTPPTEDEEVA